MIDRTQVIRMVFLAGLLNVFGAPASGAASWNLQAEWSESANPHSVWSLNEGDNPLPHIDWLERTWGSYSAAQPGWARAEEAHNRLPVWFQSRGYENYPADFVAGDIVVHTTDEANGVGNGPANVRWTSPFNGVVNLVGGVWMGRDIGRVNNWTIYKNSTALTSGGIASGDPYSRTNPFSFAAGSGGTGAVTGLSVATGDVIKLEFNKSGTYGDFVGVDLTITTEVVTSPPAFCTNLTVLTPNGQTNLNFCSAGPGKLQIFHAHPNAELRWAASTNAYYLLQASESVAPVNWSNVFGITLGNGSNLTVIQPITAIPQRFFRLLTTE